MTHTYDVLFIGVLAIGLALALRGAWTPRRVGIGLAVAAGATLLPLAPFMHVLLGAGGERLSLPPALPGDYAASLRYWVLSPLRYVLLGYAAPGSQPFQLHVVSVQVGLVITIACLIASVACLFLPQLRWARPWFVAAVVFTLIGMWTTSSNSAMATALSSLWYGVRPRLHAMIGPVYGVLVIAGAVAIGLALRRLSGRLSDRAPAMTPRATAGAAAGLVIACLIILTAFPATWRPLRSLFKAGSPVGSSYPAAFAWLAAHTSPGRVVAYDRNRDFMTWSYADYGTPLLFGIPPLPTVDQENYDRRLKAWNWLVGNPGAQPAGCLVRHFGIQYVIVGKRKIPGPWLHNYEPATLQASDRLGLVQQFGSIDIYEITDAGLQCSNPK